MHEALQKHFFDTFGTSAEFIFSAPGRTEISGNHTDHQLGCVLAAAVNLETVGAFAKNGSSVVRLYSEPYGMCEVGLSSLAPRAEEQNTTRALIRGVAAGIAERGHTLGGFDAYISSTVLPGSGLSSSAAFEVLLGTAMSGMFDCGLSAVELAQIGQFAENVYFGKPSGLMDQMASSVGGMVMIDFADAAHPEITPIDFDFSESGCALCIIDSRASHAELTDEYAAIPREMHEIAAYFGKKVLRELPEEDFRRELPALRRRFGDRAVLRAMHLYAENRRVKEQAAALQRKDFEAFLALVRASGISSWTLLQNISPAGASEHQELAFTLALAQRCLGGRGAVRVHGGGFAGTVQAFVPQELLDGFCTEIDRVLGEGSCQVLSIRKEGGVRLL